jgi:hypothetical protein
MVRFSDFLAGAEPTEARLLAYLAAHPEWVRLEFKEARQVPVHGLRIAISALANTVGGDLFLGVKDDGVILGCSFDSVAISEVLRQTGAPVREDTRTNLVDVVRDPKFIPLVTGNRVWWLDVPEFGWVVGAMKEDGTLGLYDRPGANSPEVIGFAAVDLYNRPSRARLLRKVYEEAESIERGFNYVFQGPGYVSDHTTAPLRRLVESREWDQFARKEEREWIRSNSYLAPFLRLPADYEMWGNLPYGRQTGEMIQGKNQLAEALRQMRAYLERERIFPRPA